MASSTQGCIHDGNVARPAYHEPIASNENDQLSEDATETCITERPAPPATPCGETASKLITTEILVPDPYPLLENPLDVRIPLHLTWTQISEDYEDPLRPLMESIEDETRKRLSQLEKPLLVIFRFGNPVPDGNIGRSLATYHYHDARVLAIQERPEYLNGCWKVVEGVVWQVIGDLVGKKEWEELGVPVRFYYGNWDICYEVMD
ncbi:MAG: hypothetical protein LQ337_005325 [Flavoplaca oasis]|nr:MAG: hypothetical protein LQ337_005325 [Flavoplaca oasis]